MPDGEEVSLDVRVTDTLLYFASRAIFYMIIILFTLISALMIMLAFFSLWITLTALPVFKLDSLFEAIGFTTVSAAVFELARTMFDEELKSRTKMNAPRKIRRFVSRFMTVIIISLSIEFLTMVFRYSHKPDEFSYLYQSGVVAAGIALVFVAWSYFNKTSVGVEEWEDKCLAGRKNNGPPSEHNGP
jgi:hypothetical protein